jgi:RNA-directed DNA polymerase
MNVLPKRMSKYDLTVHPEKTRLIQFDPDQGDDTDTTEGERSPPTTFDFLGFTHTRDELGKEDG